MADFRVAAAEQLLFEGKPNVWLPFLGYKEWGFDSYRVTGSRIYIRRQVGFIASEEIERKIRLVSEQRVTYTWWQMVRNWLIKRANEAKLTFAIRGRKEEMSREDIDSVRESIEFHGVPLIGSLYIKMKEDEEIIVFRNIEFPERLRTIIRLQAEFKELENIEKHAPQSVKHIILHHDDTPIRRYQHDVWSPPKWGSLPPMPPEAYEEVYEDITGDDDEPLGRTGSEFFDTYYRGRTWENPNPEY